MARTGINKLTCDGCGRTAVRKVPPEIQPLRTLREAARADLSWHYDGERDMDWCPGCKALVDIDTAVRETELGVTMVDGPPEGPDIRTVAGQHWGPNGFIEPAQWVRDRHAWNPKRTDRLAQLVELLEPFILEAWQGRSPIVVGDESLETRTALADQTGMTIAAVLDTLARLGVEGILNRDLKAAARMWAERGYHSTYRRPPVDQLFSREGQ